MAYSVPEADFETSTLSGGITATATTATIGTGLDIPATNGILHLDYDSSTAVGSDNGPETISYATYTTGTGGLTGLVRGLANTDNGTPGEGVAHANGASVSCGISAVHLQQSPQYDTWNAAGTLTYASADSPTFTATISGDSTGAIYPGVRVKAEQSQAISNYWTFNSDNSDSKGGATMGNIATPTYTSGKFGNALTLNGTTQALSITDAAAFQLGKLGVEFTIGLWIKTSATGAYRCIFQSYSDNTNANGITLGQNDQNKLEISVGNNAASGIVVGAGTTTITDGNWHYVVWTFRNNYVQLYLDGNLEISGYMTTPTYAATNYVRIGCLNTTGSNGSFFSGQIDDLFLINGYALDEQTIKAKYVADTAQGTGDITLTKYFLCTASSYSNPNTTVTLYGGTDHSLANATISNAYYSTQKAPLGFPLAEEKWTVEYTDANSGSQASPVSGTWYNTGSRSITAPIGSWRLSYKCTFGGYKSTSTTTGDLFVGLATANNIAPLDDLKSYANIEGASSTIAIRTPAFGDKGITLAVKKTYYLNNATSTAAINSIEIHRPTLKATSTLL